MSCERNIEEDDIVPKELEDCEKRIMNINTDFPLQGNMFIDIAAEMIRIENELVCNLRTLTFPHPVAYVYSPLEYAKELHMLYVNRFCQSTKELLFLGMNPGPFGMAQTGVPFGDVNAVRDWMHLTGDVEKPLNEHPKRQIFGMNCPRNEVSGQRFWGLFQDISKTPERFFQNAFVYNYCPLMFMKDSAKNITPNELKAETQKMLMQLCDSALCKVISLLQTKTVIALGRYAEKRARLSLNATAASDVRIIFLMHPSPINPSANRGWHDMAKRQLTEAGLISLIS